MNISLLLSIFVPLLVVTFCLYYYMKQKIEGHDFRIVNHFRPILNVLLFLLLESFVFVLMLIWFTILGPTGEDGFVFSGGLFFMAIMISILVFFPFVGWGRENVAKKGENYAIYLRSFRSDKLPRQYFKHFFSRKAFQIEDIYSVFSGIKCIYPLYAIGNPNETISFFKRAKTVYKTDEDWQDAVNNLKRNAKIILINIDGTDGLVWEINNLDVFLYKALFIVESNDLFEQFCARLKKGDIKDTRFKDFPSAYGCPEIYWWDNKKNTWEGGYISIKTYLNLHPWQEEDVDAVVDSLIQNSTMQYRVNQLPTFLKGNKKIKRRFPIWMNVLFALFPYYFGFYSMTKTTLSDRTNENKEIFYMYFIWFFIFYHSFLFTLPYTIHNGAFSHAIKMLAFSLPINVFSAINGPKSYWLKHSYLKREYFNRKVLKNSLIGIIIILIAMGLGYYSKYG